MLTKSKPGWWMPEAAATPEDVFLNRRAFMAASGVSIAGALVPAGIARADDADPTADLYPAPHNESFELEREVTPEKYNLNFNNFYEFGSHKQIAGAAQKLEIRPWEVRIDGDVESELTVGIDDLIRRMPLEERLYRHRCVEAWSMAVPWTGFPMRSLVDFAKPLSRGRYVRMETFMDPQMAPGQRQAWYPWPYVEGLTIEEATNDLTFLVTGAYGKPVAKQMGAPLRLATPWKYGFKSIKSIVRFTFTEDRPRGMWEALQESEYGFWANVNPDVPHPRWSQATEEVLGTGERVPTMLFNGYGDYVAGLYTGYEGEKLYM
ncbi:protein-methionine-sulfoxide reductase catalytic subunit MsrP [Microbaculum marinum]|uniref:Protein-methionine-sulfoxide reductase catalytic subunit MsrP n=1 Tax=Microbaculum marinum TaxID=1764581 RepID=A0AAW9RV43_9HYPH